MESLLTLVAKELGLPRDRLKVVVKGQPLSEAVLKGLQDGGEAWLEAGRACAWCLVRLLEETTLCNSGCGPLLLLLEELSDADHTALLLRTSILC